MHDELVAWLDSHAPIVAVFDGRTYHEWMPQGANTFPALVYRQVGGLEHAPDFEPPDDETIDQVGYQFDVYGDSSAVATTASKAFDSVFRKFRGTMGAAKIQLVERTNISHLGEIDGDKQRRRVSIDYTIYFSLS